MLWSSRRGFCFWRAYTSGILRHIHFGEMCISVYFVTFSKMAPEAKPLCSRDSHRSSVQNLGLHSQISRTTNSKSSISWPECPPEFPNDADDGDDDVSTIFPSGQSPIEIARSAKRWNIPFGNPALRQVIQMGFAWTSVAGKWIYRSIFVHPSVFISLYLHQWKTFDMILPIGKRRQLQH